MANPKRPQCRLLLRLRSFWACRLALEIFARSRDEVILGQPPIQYRNFILGINKVGILKLFLLAILFLGLIIAWLGFGERGFIHLYGMEKERQVHLERIYKLEEENKALLAEINRLRTDKEYIENFARKELNLLKDDEIHYRFMKEKGYNNHTEKPKK